MHIACPQVLRSQEVQEQSLSQRVQIPPNQLRLPQTIDYRDLRMVRRTFSSTAELVIQTNKGSEGRCRWRQVHQVKAKKGNKGGRKAKKKKGGPEDHQDLERN